MNIHQPIPINYDISMKWAEQAVLRATLQVLEDADWTVSALHDGEDTLPLNSIDEAIKEASGIDDIITIHLSSDTGDISWLQYITGNGVDCVHDYGGNLGDIPFDVYNYLVDNRIVK